MLIEQISQMSSPAAVSASLDFKFAGGLLPPQREIQPSNVQAFSLAFATSEFVRAEQRRSRNPFGKSATMMSPPNTNDTLNSD